MSAITIIVLRFCTPTQGVQKDWNDYGVDSACYTKHKHAALPCSNARISPNTWLYAGKSHSPETGECDNQQGSRVSNDTDPSETTRHAPAVFFCFTKNYSWVKI